MEEMVPILQYKIDNVSILIADSLVVTDTGEEQEEDGLRLQSAEEADNPAEMPDVSVQTGAVSQSAEQSGDELAEDSVDSAAEAAADEAEYASAVVEMDSAVNDGSGTGIGTELTGTSDDDAADDPDDAFADEAGDNSEGDIEDSTDEDAGDDADDDADDDTDDDAEDAAEDESDADKRDWSPEAFRLDALIRGGEQRRFYGKEIKKTFRKSEVRLLHFLKTQPEKTEFELLQSSTRYPFLYHLSEERGFITEVMGLDGQTSVLEIGAECGGATAALLRQAGSVDCICSHERHANINALRNRDKSYSIFVGPIESLSLDKKYDVVTLIGSLSYASRYSESRQPFTALLRYAVEHLAPGGRLFIAVDNTLGMKFLAGAAYDFRPEAFYNLQNPAYSTERSPYRTFTKSQLVSMLNKEGLDASYFYYPYPDFRFPALIYSDDMYMEPSYLNAGKEFQFPRFAFFNESLAYITLNGTEEIKVLANSFLVEAWRNV